MKRILLFSPRGAGDHYYGPGMSAYRMYLELNRCKEEIQLSLLHGYPKQANMDLFHNQFYLSSLKKNDPIRVFLFIWKVRAWIKKNASQFDAVHCLSGFHHSFMTAYWFEQAGVPALIKIAQSGYTGFNNNSRISRLLGLASFRRRHCNKISGYISISSEIRAGLLDAGIDEGRIFDIPNGVNTDRFKPVNADEKRALRYAMGYRDYFTLLFTGGFQKRKNPLAIVQAFFLLKETYQDIQLILVGPDRDGGKERHAITALIKEKGIQDIHLVPYVREIERFYQLSDLFVLPSSDEGLSNSLLEAQASGLPSIVTKISGSEDLVSDGVNGSFTTGVFRDIADKIDHYLQNTRSLHSQSKAAREKIIKEYDSQMILNKHLELLDLLVARNKME